MIFFSSPITVSTTTRPLAYFRSFSSATRRRLAQYDHRTERFLKVFVPIFAFGMAQGSAGIAVVSIYLAIYQQQPVPVVQMVILVAELAVLPAVILYTYKLVLLFFKILLLVCIAWSLHVKKITERAFKLQKKVAAATFPCVSAKDEKKHQFFERKPHPSKSNHLARSAVVRIEQFMQEHTKLLINLVHFNQHFASVLIFWYFAPLLFSSIFILCLLYFLPVMFIIKVNIFYI